MLHSRSFFVVRPRDTQRIWFLRSLGQQPPAPPSHQKQASRDEEGGAVLEGSAAAEPSLCSRDKKGLAAGLARLIGATGDVILMRMREEFL
jgi:hypothetical protein